MSFSKTIIQGNLGQDPEIKYTQNQVAVCTISVATSEKYTKDGQPVEEVEWHRVNLWNKNAENVAKYLKKGSAVLVEGRNKTRSWEDKDGVKRYSTEIVAQNIQFLGSPGERPQQAPAPGASFEEPPF